MDNKWADYSFARPDPSQLKADGIVGVLRYLAPDDVNNHGKILFPAERDELLGAGLDIALNFEWYEGRCNEGAASGTADAKTALTEAESLGYPAGKCIYFSHDTGIYDWTPIESYFRAARVALGGKYKLGAYGSYDLISHLFSLGLIDYGWQTVAWSNGQRDPEAVIYQTGEQILGGSADVDLVTSTDIGSWLDGPTQDWFDMVTVAELQQVIDERLIFILPRVVGLLREGTPNVVFTSNNAGGLVDHVGLDGEIKSVKAAVDELSLTVSNGIDYQKLASAVIDEMYRRLAS